MKEFFIDNIISDQLNKVKKRVLTKDRDFVMVIDGEEGVGKSVLAMQIAKYLDPEFNLDKICFNSDSFIKAIKSPEMKKGACIVLDEAFSAINSRASMTEVNRSMIGVATEMRQRNLFVIIVLPSFFDLDKYFALWRCKSLIHVYFTPTEERRYIIFPKTKKKLLYLNGKKTYDYSKPKSPFPPSTFSNYYPVNEEEYRIKKANAFKKRVVSNQARKWLTQRNSYMKHLIRAFGLTQEEVSNVPALYGSIPVTRQQVSLVLKELEREAPYE